MSTTGFVLPVVAGLALVGVGLSMRKVLRLAALAKPAQYAAWKHLTQLRLDKLEKPAMMILSLQKGGSTLLCYVCSLINTRNAVNQFRNDFDLVPMLSFPQAMVFQNVNARQEGKYQLYKINGRARDFYARLSGELKVPKVVWISREFDGYYRSVFWWVKSFYPRIKPMLHVPLRIMFFLRFISFSTFKSQTLKLMAEDHVSELFAAYQLVLNEPRERFLAISYEHLTREKEPTLRRLASWFGVDLDAAALRSIVQKTSKEAMAQGDRFDPLHFGEGGGQTKVNLEAHEHALDDADKASYEAIFRSRFAGTGIGCYAELIETLRQLQEAPHAERQLVARAAS
jgi:Sulfotransferase domain